MTAPTTHWSTTGQLHTGTVAGCEECEEEAELLVSYRAHVGHKPSADEVTVPDTAALDATARTWSRTGGLAPLIDPGNALAEHWRRVAQDLEANAAEARANERHQAIAEFVAWVATHRAFNGSRYSRGQSLYNEGINGVLDHWAADFMLEGFDAEAEARYRANREKARESDSLPPRRDAGPKSGPLSHRGDDDGPQGAAHYPRSGTCTACGHPAEQAPSGRWWHLGPACPNRSQTVFAVTVVEDGVMRETTDAERPARFRADDGEVGL